MLNCNPHSSLESRPQPQPSSPAFGSLFAGSLDGLAAVSEKGGLLGLECRSWRCRVVRPGIQGVGVEAQKIITEILLSPSKEAIEDSGRG